MHAVRCKRIGKKRVCSIFLFGYFLKDSQNKIIYRIMHAEGSEFWTRRFLLHWKITSWKKIVIKSYF